MSIELVLLHEPRLFLNGMYVQHTLLDGIKQEQVGDAKIERIKVTMSKGKVLGLMENEQGIIRFQNRICVAQKRELEKRIMSKSHDTKYSIHPGGMKMCRDLR